MNQISIYSSTQFNSIVPLELALVCVSDSHSTNIVGGKKCGQSSFLRLHIHSNLKYTLFAQAQIQLL